MKHQLPLHTYLLQCPALGASSASNKKAPIHICRLDLVYMQYTTFWHLELVKSCEYRREDKRRKRESTTLATEQYAIMEKSEQTTSYGTHHFVSNFTKTMSMCLLKSEAGSRMS
jgi:hypothetical protein